MTAIIQGGTVRIKDGVKAAEAYAPNREAEVTLHFSAPSADTDLSLHIARVSDLAKSHLARLLSTTAPTAEAAAPKADLPLDTRASKGPVREKKQPAAPVTEPIQTSPFPTPSEPDAAPTAATPSDDEWDTPATPAPLAKEVTDEDLNAAVQKRNADTQNTAGIRELIASFNPDPTQRFQLRQIEQAKRADFLVKLAAVAKV